MTLWVAAPHGKSPPYQIWWPSHCGSGDMFLAAEEEDCRSSCFKTMLERTRIL